MSLVQVRTNLKSVAKDLLGAKLLIYKIVGAEIADGLWREFEILVNETPQYTGTTAASWNIAAKGAGSFGGLDEQYFSAKPLHTGHHTAVQKALARNFGNLDDLYDKVKWSGINVWNEAPGITEGVAETGPLRAVNLQVAAEGAFARFQERVATRIFEPFKDVVEIEHLKQKADTAGMRRVASNL